MLWTAAIVLALVLFLSRWLVADLVALAGLGILFVIRPDLSLPFIAASLPFWQRPEALLGLQFAHFEIFVWLGAAGLAVRWAVRKLAGGRGQGPVPRRLALAGLDWPVLALVASGLISSLFAQGQGVAWREWRILFVGGALFYGLVTRSAGAACRRFSPWPAVNGLLVGMAAAGLIGLWQLVTGEGRVDVEGVWRVRALYGSPNNLALLLDRGVPLAVALAAFGLRSSPSASSPAPRGEAGFEAVAHAGRGAPIHEDRSNDLSRFYYAGAAVIMTLACVATFSKGALLLGLPAGLAVVLLGGARRSRQRWPLWALGGLAVIGAAGAILLFRTPRFADLFNFQGGTSFVRLKLWQGAWQMALAHLLVGVGPDNFLYAYRTRYVLPGAWQELNLSHPHNLVLDLWTRLGIVGVLAAGWALVAGMGRGWRLFRGGSAEIWPLALGLLATLAVTVAHGLIDNSLFLPDLMGIFMLTLGIFQQVAAETRAE